MDEEFVCDKCGGKIFRVKLNSDNHLTSVLRLRCEACCTIKVRHILRYDPSEDIPF